MDFSPQYGREATKLPSIFIGSGPSDGFGSPGQAIPRGKFSSSPPRAMSIPGSHDRNEPPPPLPPPPRPFDNPGPYEYRGRRHEQGSFESGIGSMRDEKPSYIQRGVHRDEGYESYGSTNRSLPGFGAFHDKYRPSNDDYCEILKNKLNPSRALDKSSPRSSFSPSGDGPSRRSTNDHRLPPLMTFPLPIRSATILEEPDRFTQTPHSAVSPRAPFHSLRDYRSPEADHSPRHRSRRTDSGSFPDDVTVSTQGSYDNMQDVDDMEMDEPSTSSMRRLRLDDHSREYHAAGLKRRASSPPADESTLHGMPSQGDLLRRRDLPSRGSPTPRLATLPKGSVSSVSSAGRSGSYVSTFSMGAASSMTSMNSFGRRSPVSMSPGGMSPITSEASCSSPFTTPISLNPSPRASISRAPHQRSDSRPVVSPRKLTEVSKPNGHKMQEFYMCECCPKKPKKFDTSEELRAHEAEKQYGCSFCGNRFKNKNEAERHQNSLHVRRHSWSCKALSNYNQAFHESTIRPGEADTCGYCGKEFDRTGPSQSICRAASDQDWEERIQHLTEVHKFRECNSSKKFYRADHFRQHLKHSHAGSSGKWTNMLENACMMEEDPTPTR